MSDPIIQNDMVREQLHKLLIKFIGDMNDLWFNSKDKFKNEQAYKSFWNDFFSADSNVVLVLSMLTTNRLPGYEGETK